MKWIIASISLWLLGSICFYAALISFRDLIRHVRLKQPAMVKEEADNFLRAVLLATLFLVLAAWVA